MFAVLGVTITLFIPLLSAAIPETDNVKVGWPDHHL
jgi:hypothetical protein